MSRRSAGSFLKAIAEGRDPHAGSNRVSGYTNADYIERPTARHGKRPFTLFENRQITYGATRVDPVLERAVRRQERAPAGSLPAEAGRVAPVRRQPPPPVGRLTPT